MAIEPKDNYTVKRERFFVRREDYGRTWFIVPAFEDTDGHLHLMRMEIASTVWGRNILTGSEPSGTWFTREAVQELMDGLWESGLRPTRR